jgi:non-ribosomal peptide synthetase component F
VLLDELGQAYSAIRDGRPPSLPELPIDYADYALWQRARLSGETLERLTSYWKSRLAGAAPALELPTDRPRPPRQAFEGAVVWLRVQAGLARALVDLGRGERATPFMTLMAAFKALLFQWTGQEDVLVGSPAAMRTRRELAALVGLFANTLVYRTSLAGRPSFRELVRRVRQTALGVYEHQDLPFEQIVQAVQPPRDLSRSPLVQVNMRVEGREPQLQLPGVDSERLEVDPHIARFDLAIELGEQEDGGYAGYLEYDTALYEAATAQRVADDFVAMLDAVVAAPDEPLAALLRRD